MNNLAYPCVKLILVMAITYVIQQLLLRTYHSNYQGSPVWAYFVASGGNKEHTSMDASLNLHLIAGTEVYVESVFSHTIRISTGSPSYMSVTLIQQT